MKQEFPYYSRFADLWIRLGAKGKPEPYFTLLNAQYSEPFRFHHTLGNHIIPMLDEFSGVRELVEHPDVAELAIWYHDVSDPRKRGHEDTSAAIFYEICTGGSGLEAIAEMGRNLVLSTKEHVKSQDLTAMLLGDCDYAIFGKPREKFEEHDDNIRKEYSLLVPVANWPRFEERRREFLERLRGGVFLTPYFIERYESQARKNVEWALKRTYRTYASPPGGKAVREKKVVRKKPAEKKYLLRELLPHLHPYYDPDFDEESGTHEPLGGLGLLDHWFEFEPEEKDERPGGGSGMFDHWFEFD